MSIPKIYSFSNYNHYPTDPNPTTDMDMQDYMANQNAVLSEYATNTWQPTTSYEKGAVIRSSAMPAGVVAIATDAGTTSNVEPDWTGGNTAVSDGNVVWEMLDADGLPRSGGTMAGTINFSTITEILNIATSAGNNLKLISEGNALKVQYTDGATTKTVTLVDASGNMNVQGEITQNGQTLNNTYSLNTHTHSYAGSSSVGGAATSANKLNANAGSSSTPVYFSNGIPVACSSALGASANGGIVAQSLGTNGYVKFANGLILQWGKSTATSAYTPIVTFTYPLAMSTVYSVTYSGLFNSKEQKYTGWVKTASATSATIMILNGSGSVAPSCFVFVVGK
ncbi:hypothetical protein [Phascolarctobacterium sp.]|uniref:gp53-like domain-containing protein n=1 Tax=Phascolarctobacterium sp. TaxID=2049039 RepID=UPI003863420C